MTDIARGLEGVLLTETRLSLVNGRDGVLIIGGYPVAELAPNACFEETLHLLWHGKLPKKAELDTLRATLAAQRGLPAVTLGLLKAAAEKKLPTMDALRLGTDSLSLDDAKPGDTSREAHERRAMSIVARVPTIVATYWRLLHGQQPVAPDAKLGHAANYLWMLTGEAPRPAAARGLETYLNTVIDHGMNASTFTARVIASTRSDMVSAIVGAIGALKGPLHGGAPGPALDMVFELRQEAEESGKTLSNVTEVWSRNAVRTGERLMGFGHRVYKVRDPRADVLGHAAEALFEGAEDKQLYEDARTVEEVCLMILEELKPGRNLKTNVEFYTALLLHGVGMDAQLFSPTFGVSRVGGWTAHVIEQFTEDRLIRPDVRYTGPTDLKWVPVEAR